MQRIEYCLPNHGKRAQAVPNLDHSPLADLSFRRYGSLAQSEGFTACSHFRNVWHAISYQT